MPVTRVCIHHVNNAEAGKSLFITGECLAHMMYECAIHQVSVIGGDANKMAYQKQGQEKNASYVTKMISKVGIVGYRIVGFFRKTQMAQKCEKVTF